MRTFVRVRLERLRANYESVRDAGPPGTDVVSVLKADAYGHGAVRVAQELRAVGCGRFAVASLEEALALHQAGIREEILVLSGFLPGQEADLAEHGLIPFIYSRRQLDCWRAEATRRSARLPYHLELDTGMTRLGVRLDDDWLARVGEARELELVGVGTHLACAEAFDDPLAERQLACFSAWRQRLSDAGVKPRWAHFANSAALAYRPLEGANLVRAGLALYGYVNAGRGAAAPGSRLALRPVLEWRAAVLDVREVAEGARIGYDGVFTADRALRVAVLGVGYGDGYRRELSGGDVLLGGVRRRIVGRVSMDLTVVDLGEGPPVAPGDEATLLGDELDAVELAERCETIPYEILCGVGARVTRRYVED